MKHSELISIFESKLKSSQKNQIKKVNKGRISEMNYVNILFTSEEIRDQLLDLLFKPELQYPNYYKCEKRYGWGIIINEYRLPNK